MMKIFVRSVFLGIYLLVGIISMICCVSFFELSHTSNMSLVLSIAFELGAMATVVALIMKDVTNKNFTWFLAILLCLFQCFGNSFYAYMHLEGLHAEEWAKFVGLEYEDPEALLNVKRIIAYVTGAILPIVALSFIKSLADTFKTYVNGVEDNKIVNKDDELLKEKIKEVSGVVDEVDLIEKPKEESKNFFGKIKKKITNPESRRYWNGHNG